MFKSEIRWFALETPARVVARPVHEYLTRIELTAAKALDVLPPESPSWRDPEYSRLVSKITAIIKTFERPAALSRLLESAHRLFPSLRIIVADDSRRANTVPGAELVRLPFNSGVSIGRQAALEKVSTPYTWVLDDDFVLYRGTRLLSSLAMMEAEARIDILGGPVIDLPICRKNRSNPHGIYPTTARPVLPIGTRLSGLPVCDKVPNFFIARTERVRLVGWTPEIKRLDHADFFTRARGILVTVYNDRFRCLHAQTPFDREYMRQRNNFSEDQEVLRWRYDRTRRQS